MKQTRFKSGECVMIDGSLPVAVSMEAPKLFGRPATFVGYTAPHGFARICYDGEPGQWIVHPEALTRTSQKRVV